MYPSFKRWKTIIVPYVRDLCHRRFECLLKCVTSYCQIATDPSFLPRGHPTCPESRCVTVVNRLKTETCPQGFRTVDSESHTYVRTSVCLFAADSELLRLIFAAWYQLCMASFHLYQLLQWLAQSMRFEAQSDKHLLALYIFTILSTQRSGESESSITWIFLDITE